MQLTTAMPECNTQNELSVSARMSVAFLVADNERTTQ
ncbi:hypothetical protein F442_19723 [Phytophthora nicotianae P10297]|uniref:Uncharacterized protein n=1 Tax=Phytophthora nicotianae P10297 TaxID=1317064 RepID=W2YB34_PHYNI|nr:hypothetical protein F442_19723 [Phytophthora nicotianae P10297]